MSNQQNNPIQNEKEPNSNNVEELAIFNKIFMGAFDDSIPETKRKLVRIFTSSTFTGLIIYFFIYFG